MEFGWPTLNGVAVYGYVLEYPKINHGRRVTLHGYRLYDIKYILVAGKHYYKVESIIFVDVHVTQVLRQWMI